MKKRSKNICKKTLRVIPDVDCNGFIKMSTAGPDIVEAEDVPKKYKKAINDDDWVTEEPVEPAQVFRKKLNTPITVPVVYVYEKEEHDRYAVGFDSGEVPQPLFNVPVGAKRPGLKNSTR